uniref:Lipase domain-containing protein n=1 Tax=Lygus hesperus TaxID=30085 RepID=A0A0K8T9W1_LYGHE
MRKMLTSFVLVVVFLIGPSKGDWPWPNPVENLAISFHNPELFWWLLDWFIPNSLIEENVFFYSYTRGNYEVPEQLYINNEMALASSNFDVTKKTKIVVHGFSTDYKARSAQGPKEEYLTYDNVNVITPDYGNINQDPTYFFFYTAAKSYRIGRFIGQFVVFLIEQGVDPDNIHIIGHSLGGHIAGFAAKYAKSKGKQIGRVTGLDPCYPVYEYNTAGYRLDSGDAKFTDCIFTTYGIWGLGIPVCQANFFPNGVGTSQPGCYREDIIMGSSCGHSRVVEYFIESIKPQSAFDVHICEGVPKVESPPRCWPTTRTLMGEYANPEASGMFYLKTNAESPYSRG